MQFAFVLRFQTTNVVFRLFLIESRSTKLKAIATNHVILNLLNLFYNIISYIFTYLKVIYAYKLIL